MQNTTSKNLKKKYEQNLYRKFYNLIILST